MKCIYEKLQTQLLHRIFHIKIESTLHSGCILFRLKRVYNIRTHNYKHYFGNEMLRQPYV